MRSPSDVEQLLAEPALPATFSVTDVEGLPDAVTRYFLAAIEPGTPLATSVRLRMRGRIKIGRWLPFRARQVLAPHRGTVWSARVGGVIVGSDQYADGQGGMSWKLAGLIPLVRADNPDVARSSAERAAGEAMWVPTCVLPRFGVTWSATGANQINARFDVDGHPVQLEYELEDGGGVRSVVFNRWGDPDNTGTWEQLPFGCEVSDYTTFGGVTVPSGGRAGWFYGTDRWTEGIFFRYQVTDLELISK